MYSGQQDLEGLAGAEGPRWEESLEFRAEDAPDAKEAQHQLFGRSLWPLEKMGGDGVGVGRNALGLRYCSSKG